MKSNSKNNSKNKNKKAKKSTAKKTVTQSKNGFERVEVGENLPYYLL